MWFQKTYAPRVDKWYKRASLLAGEEFAGCTSPPAQSITTTTMTATTTTTMTATATTTATSTVVATCNQKYCRNIFYLSASSKTGVQHKDIFSCRKRGHCSPSRGSCITDRTKSSVSRTSRFATREILQLLDRMCLKICSNLL